MIAASIALIAGMGAANAKSSHSKKAHAKPSGPMIQRNMSLGRDPAQRATRPALERPAPQVTYPQSPPGGY
jgi:hypothetical protein